MWINRSDQSDDCICARSSKRVVLNMQILKILLSYIRHTDAAKGQLALWNHLSASSVWLKLCQQKLNLMHFLKHVQKLLQWIYHKILRVAASFPCLETSRPAHRGLMSTPLFSQCIPLSTNSQKYATRQVLIWKIRDFILFFLLGG